MKRVGFLTLHRWLGLFLAPFLMLQALTGIILVIHEMSLPAAAPARVPISALVANAQAASPGLAVRRLYLPGSTGTTAFAELAGPDGRTTYAELDPATGTVMQVGALWQFPYRAAVQVHYRLADGATGMIIILAVGAALTLASLTGFVFWWPGRSRVIQALKVRRSLPARMRLRQWHRTVGALVSVLAFLSSTTGILLIAPDVIPALTSTPAQTAVVRNDWAPDRIDRAVSTARERFPQAPLRDVRFPPADRLDLNFDAPERNARAVHTVAVRLSDGAVINSLPAKDNTVLWMKVLHLHTGQAFGIPGPLILLIEALGLIFLAYAGTRMWLTAQAARKKAGQ